MIDTEIRLDRTFYKEFCDSMNKVDAQAISLRDRFIDGIQARTDAKGTMIIDCPDINFELGALRDDKITVEVTVSQDKNALEYKNTVCVVKIASELEKAEINKRIEKEEDCYTPEENLVNQKFSIQYAA
jgi:hypothetical protein